KIMFGFFANLAPENVDVAPDIAAYLDFVVAIFLAFGLAFETPIAALRLHCSVPVPMPSLDTALPHVFLGCFVVGMLLTPPVPFSQTLLAIPMYILYEGGLVLARVLLPEKTAEENNAHS